MIEGDGAWYHCWRCDSNCHSSTPQWLCALCGSDDVTLYPERQPVPAGQLELFDLGSVDGDFVPDIDEYRRIQDRRWFKIMQRRLEPSLRELELVLR